MLWEIVLEKWVYPKWQGLPLIPTRAAIVELDRYYLSLEDVKKVLEDGYDCVQGKRKRNVFERCLRKGGKDVKAVVAKSYNYSFASECWVVVHVGVVSR